MQLRPKPAPACEAKMREPGDQAEALRRLAELSAASSPPRREPAAAPREHRTDALVVLSPLTADRARRVVGMMPAARRERTECGIAPGAWAESALRRAGAVLVVLGCDPQELAAGFGLVRWIAGRRLDAPLGVLILHNEEYTPDTGIKRRFAAAVGAHVARGGVSVEGMCAGRAGWRGRRAVGQLVARLESCWHPDCGRVGL